MKKNITKEEEKALLEIAKRLIALEESLSTQMREFL